MKHPGRWIAGVAAAVVLAVLLLLGLAAALWLPNEKQLATDLGERFGQATGIGLQVGRVHWSLQPSPVVVLEDLATDQPTPITVRRIVLRPRLGDLWHRRIAVASLEIDGAVLPSGSIRAFRGRWPTSPSGKLPGGPWTLAAIPLERLRLRDVTWIDRRDIALAYDADVVFDAGWRPRIADVWRPEVTPPARLHLARDGDGDRWQVLIDVGGGSWNGQAEFRDAEGAPMRLTATLAPKNVDIKALVQSFARHAPVDGRAQGETTLDAEGATFGDLLRSLHTRTRFSIAPAALTGFDLKKAISSAGISRGGTTPLDSLTGTLDTQVTEEGTAMRYSGLKARSGVLSASGNATVLNRRLSGMVAVDIVDGVVGVPLKIGGTIESPELSLTGGALTGAAVGTAVLPGVGTAIGARIGQQVEQLFGSAPRRPEVKPEAKPAPR